MLRPQALTCWKEWTLVSQANSAASMLQVILARFLLLLPQAAHLSLAAAVAATTVCLSVFLPECIGVDCPCTHIQTERNPQTASLAAAASSQEDSFLLPCHVNVLQAFPVHITMTTSPLLANIHIHTQRRTHTLLLTPSFSLYLCLLLIPP